MILNQQPEHTDHLERGLKLFQPLLMGLINPSIGLGLRFINPSIGLFKPVWRAYKAYFSYVIDPSHGHLYIFTNRRGLHTPD